MDNKQQAFYSAFYSFSRKNIEDNPNCIMPFFEKMLKIDFEQFISCWEFFLSCHEPLLQDSTYNKIFTSDILNLSCEKNYQKTLKTILANPNILKAVYQQSMFSVSPSSAFDIINNLLLTQKIEDCESIFKLIQKNTIIKTSFGENMVIIMDRLFIETLKKQGNVSKKVELSKKVKSLLVEYISKIRGPEKALLEQRIREIS